MSSYQYLYGEQEDAHSPFQVVTAGMQKRFQRSAPFPPQETVKATSAPVVSQPAVAPLPALFNLADLPPLPALVPLKPLSALAPLPDLVPLPDLAPVSEDSGASPDESSASPDEIPAIPMEQFSDVIPEELQ